MASVVIKTAEDHTFNAVTLQGLDREFLTSQFDHICYKIARVLQFPAIMTDEQLSHLACLAWRAHEYVLN